MSSLPQLLNCIMDMVEKTRRSLTVLRRCQEADREELNYWIRRYSDAEDLKKTSSSSSSQSRQQSPASQDGNALGTFQRSTCHNKIRSARLESLVCVFPLTSKPDIFFFSFPDIHRELLHRPGSGYVPDEIWKKAG